MLDFLTQLIVPLIVVVAVLYALALVHSRTTGHPNFKRQRNAYVAYLVGAGLVLIVLLAR